MAKQKRTQRLLTEVAPVAVSVVTAVAADAAHEKIGPVRLGAKGPDVAPYLLVAAGAAGMMLDNTWIRAVSSGILVIGAVKAAAAIMEPAPANPSLGGLGCGCGAKALSGLGAVALCSSAYLDDLTKGIRVNYDDRQLYAVLSSTNTIPAGASVKWRAFRADLLDQGLNILGTQADMKGVSLDTPPAGVVYMVECEIDCGGGVCGFVRQAFEFTGAGVRNLYGGKGPCATSSGTVTSQSTGDLTEPADFRPSTTMLQAALMQQTTVATPPLISSAGPVNPIAPSACDGFMWPAAEAFSPTERDAQINSGWFPDWRKTVDARGCAPCQFREDGIDYLTYLGGNNVRNNWQDGTEDAPDEFAFSYFVGAAGEVYVDMPNIGAGAYYLGGRWESKIRPDQYYSSLPTPAGDLPAESTTTRTANIGTCERFQFDANIALNSGDRIRINEIGYRLPNGDVVIEQRRMARGFDPSGKVSGFPDPNSLTPGSATPLTPWSVNPNAPVSSLPAQSALPPTVVDPEMSCVPKKPTVSENSMCAPLPSPTGTFAASPKICPTKPQVVIAQPEPPSPTECVASIAGSLLS